jgi:hypothetical protein
MAQTRKGGVDWDSPIVYDGTTMSLRQWLALVYAGKSDSELAEVLRGLGFNATKTAVCRARQRFGYHKIPGQAVMESGGLDTDGTARPTEPGSPPVLADMADVTAHDLLKSQVRGAIKDRNVSLTELSRKFDRAEPTIRAIIGELVDENYPIVATETEVRLDTKTAPSVDVEKEVPTALAEMTGHYCPFGIMSDLHAGSISMQITNMMAFARYAYAAGVRHVFVPGDLFAGHKVYGGQLSDLFAVGADKQLIVLDIALPHLDGLTYYVIGGNHDFSFIKLGGADLVRVFAAARNDVVYLGYDVADVPLTDRASVRLWHMTGGRAYAISYKLQRGIEQFSFEELMKLITGLQENPSLRFVLAGHLHAAFWSIFGPITGVQCGCFEGQTSLSKKKGWYSIVGGFIVEAWITDDGLIQRERIEWVPGLDIKLDYLNYPDVMAAVGAGPQPEKPDTVFTWEEVDI